ncbi:DUF346 domain-containing protein [Bradyrhizobium sp. Cp5.3]|uniref:DUF346 domain-containing protein n=1 Tax=Bradyrhizobium sp. Cp5.3 TaxID=443598 RepID=UPI000A055ED0
MFARGTDNALWHIWQDKPHAGPWSGRASLGGVLLSDPLAARYGLHRRPAVSQGGRRQTTFRRKILRPWSERRIGVLRRARISGSRSCDERCAPAMSRAEARR